MKEAVIVGVGDVELTNGVFAQPGSVLAAQSRAAMSALADAGFGLRDVDGLLTAGVWGLPGPGVLPTLTLAEYLGVRPRFSDSTNHGGSSFETHVAHAAMAIERGDCEVALIVYGSAQRTERSRSLMGRPPVLTLQYETPTGLPVPVGAYALAAARHMYEYRTTSEQLAEIAVAAREWAALNPSAMKRDRIDIGDVLASPMISDPLHLLDCCLITDGAGAVVMTSADNLPRVDRSPIYVRGYGEHQTGWTISSMPELTVSPAREAGKRAYAMAGIGPDDVDILQVYDSFTITVVLTLEALGFCGAGEGGEFVADGRLRPGGKLPVNTNGGGLSCLHPGMYGIFLLIEAARQLWGEAGERQVPDPRIALVNGTGGNLSCGSVCVLSL